MADLWRQKLRENQIFVGRTSTFSDTEMKKPTFSDKSRNFFKGPVDSDKKTRPTSENNGKYGNIQSHSELFRNILLTSFNCIQYAHNCLKCVFETKIPEHFPNSQNLNAIERVIESPESRLAL
jgi:hypothetical protein